MEISTATANDNSKGRLEIVSPNFSKSINFKFPDLSTQPIQLVAFEEGKGFYVTKEAEKFFETYENTKLGIITIIGKSRTGKSYLLNRVLLNRENGFHVGHTINPCTRGICLWPNEIEVENYNNEGEKLKVFVLDTEGLGATDQDEEFDTKLFIIGLLLSSYMIYNSVGTIDEKAINSLSLIINISKHLQKSNEKDFENIINCFPTFLWVLRDFSLKLVDQSGNPITPRDYLENSLKPQKGLSESAESKNRIRRLISEFFKDRDCFMLVRPTEQEKDIQNLHQLDPSKLRKEFNEHISLLRKKIYSKVRPKTFKGKFVTGRTFLTLGK